MDKKIQELKERFRYAGEREIALSDKGIDELAAIESDAFSAAMLNAVKDTATEADRLFVTPFWQKA